VPAARPPATHPGACPTLCTHLLFAHDHGPSFHPRPGTVRASPLASLSPLRTHVCWRLARADTPRMCYPALFVFCNPPSFPPSLLPALPPSLPPCLPLCLLPSLLHPLPPSFPPSLHPSLFSSIPLFLRQGSVSGGLQVCICVFVSPEYPGPAAAKRHTGARRVRGDAEGATANPGDCSAHTHTRTHSRTCAHVHTLTHTHY
jgi:hypothetical protein